MRKKLKRFFRLLRRKVFKPFLRGLCMRMIVFYQKHFSKHTCLYQPTCSEYTKRAINDYGVILGICMGIWRLLRCNPLSKGGYNPVPEKRFKLKWVI